MSKILQSLSDYLETSSAPSKASLLELQKDITELIDQKGLVETLYAIAIGLQGSKYSDKLEKIITDLRTFKE